MAPRGLFLAPGGRPRLGVGVEGPERRLIALVCAMVNCKIDWANLPRADHPTVSMTRVVDRPASGTGRDLNTGRANGLLHTILDGAPMCAPALSKDSPVETNPCADIRACRIA